MCVDITNYPELIKVLVDVINAPYDQLHKFNTALISQFDRDCLLDAFRNDADEGELHALLIDANKGDCLIAEISAGAKHKITADIVIHGYYMTRIYDIAQEMGPILEQIERDNHEAGE